MKFVPIIPEANTIRSLLIDFPLYANCMKYWGIIYQYPGIEKIGTG